MSCATPSRFVPFVVTLFSLCIGCGADVQDAAGVEVEPAPEMLGTLGAPAEHAWSLHFGGSGRDQIERMATGADGATYLLGTFEGSFAFGSEVRTARGYRDLFVAKLSADGQPEWSHQLWSDSWAQPVGLVLTPSGGVIVAGSFQGTVELPGGPLSSGDAGQATFLLRVDPAGEVLSRSTLPAGVLAVAAAPGGGLYAGGSFFGTADFGGGPVTDAGGGDAFLVRLDPDGELLDFWQYGNDASQSIRSVAVDAAGNLVASGQFNGVVDLGGGPLASGNGTWSTAVFLFKLDPDGKHVFSQHYGFAAELDLRTGPDGAIFVGGVGQGIVDFGDGAINADNPYGAYLARFEPDGALDWGLSLGGSYQSIGFDVDGAGHVIAAIPTREPSPWPLAEERDVHRVVKLNDRGRPLFDRSWARSGNTARTRVSAGPGGEAFIGGTFAGTATFGGPILVTGVDDEADVFAVKLGP